MIPETIDPRWGVPMFMLGIAAIGYIWLKVSDRAYDRMIARLEQEAEDKDPPVSPR